MPDITTTGDRPVTLHYTDTGGGGRAIVLIHGWPLSGEAFRTNIPALSAAGLRVITYDRRGFGQSDKPSGGYDFDTLSADLADLMSALDLQDAVLLGFSMGGGEVARYIGTHGTGRLAGVVLSSSICPALAVTDDNPDGAMPVEAFQDMARQCAADHPGFLDQFTTAFFSNEDGLTVSEATRQEALAIALQSDPGAASMTIEAWATDLRDDCAAIDVPLLVLHGDGDQNVPLAASSQRLPELVSGSSLHIVAGGPHGLNLSHQAEWEQAVVEFVAGL
ncbi:alpha/beta fold hydrolase [Tessaracoccus antarcticus]|uniref:Alpha/beta hydrolase n=1 Tax=Tessaracoccus antarcticus TaxID=2479848 RepID=A0A3M0G4H7_9ACTN|nr:alpha/beta hydrolase [Tessaracoccus antarcticus]RMB59744.1 alpha/beta hydrolase [Tessaracoccus antarcticus]